VQGKEQDIGGRMHLYEHQKHKPIQLENRQEWYAREERAEVGWKYTLKNIRMNRGARQFRAQLTIAWLQQQFLSGGNLAKS
jgi:hypothetical protein